LALQAALPAAPLNAAARREPAAAAVVRRVPRAVEAAPRVVVPSAVPVAASVVEARRVPQGVVAEPDVVVPLARLVAASVVAARRVPQATEATPGVGVPLAPLVTGAAQVAVAPRGPPVRVVVAPACAKPRAAALAVGRGAAAARRLAPASPAVRESAVPLCLVLSCVLALLAVRPVALAADGSAGPARRPGPMASAAPSIVRMILTAPIQVRAAAPAPPGGRAAVDGSADWKKCSAPAPFASLAAPEALHDLRSAGPLGRPPARHSIGPTMKGRCGARGRRPASSAPRALRIQLQ
jgi:hypothetical protein